MNRFLLVLGLIFGSLSSFATEFPMAYLNHYEQLVLGEISASTGSGTTFRILEIVKSNDRSLQKDKLITSTNHLYQLYPLNAPRKALLALKKHGNAWYIEYHLTGDAANNDCLTFKNNLEQISVDIETFAHGLQLIQTHTKVHIRTKFGQSDSVELLSNDFQLKNACASNVYFNHLFRSWEIYNCFNRSISFGIWPDYEKKRSAFIAHQLENTDVRSIPTGSNELHPAMPSFYNRFVRVNSDSLIEKDFLYYYDPTRDTFWLVYEFYPENAPTSAALTGLKKDLSCGMPLRAEVYRYFGDNYARSLFRYSYNYENTLIVPIYPQRGILHYFTRTQEKAVAIITKGEFTGRVEIYAKNEFQELNFNAKGLAHGAQIRRPSQFAEPIHYEHYINNEKSGLTYSTYPDGSLMYTGSYFQGRQIGEWLTYYSSAEGGKLRSKTNYCYRGNTIDRINIDAQKNHPKILSSRYIDSWNTDILEGYQVYYDTSGKAVCLQKWHDFELEYREDWMTLSIWPKASDDEDPRDTIYHTKGNYKHNSPWSGTFLVGVPTLELRGSASGYRSQRRYSINTYVEGQCTDSTVIYESDGYIEMLPAHNNTLQLITEPKPKKKWFKRKRSEGVPHWDENYWKRKQE